MRLSINGLNFIKKYEGFSVIPYLCPAGKLTIGYGHVISAGESFPQIGIAKDMAQKLLKSDVAIAERAVAKLVKTPLAQYQFDALVSFVYNIGREAFKNSTMLHMLNENKLELAADEFARWIYAGGKIQNGLVKRREEEREMFRLPLPPPITTYF